MYLHIQLKDVLLGKKLFIDWASKLETNIYLDFTRPNGERMLELGRESLVTSYMGWSYPLVSPWQERMDGRISVMVQSGLIHKWKSAASWELKTRLGRKEREELESAWSEAGFAGRSGAALTVADLAGVFVVGAVLMAAAAAAAAVEVATRICG